MKHYRVLAPAILLFLVSTFAEASPQWRTAADVSEGSRGSIVGTLIDLNEAANRLQLQTDDDRYGRISVIADTVNTQYNGFGGVINGKPEIFLGSKGFSNLRVGDRVELIPNHICPAVNLYDHLYVHRGGTVEGRWAVTARGRSQ